MSSVPQASDNVTNETVIALHHWTDTLYSFRTTRSDNYRFTPGQYARLGLADTSHVVWRAYSITSSAQDDFLEFYVVDIPDGAFTSRAKTLKPGDKVLVVKQSYGFMTTDSFSDGEDLWMLATGTGLGPFVSILQDPAVWTKFRNLILVHGVRTADELAYQDQLFALQQQSPFATLPARLHILQTTTREEAPLDPPRLHGRITTLLETGELEKRAGVAISVNTSRIMLCGNPKMIEDARIILRARGLRPCRRAIPGQFVTENYW